MKVVLFTSIALYVLACALPALDTQKSGTVTTMTGLHTLSIGWTGIFAGVFAWFANPVWLFGLIFGFFRKPTLCASLGVTALVIGLSTFTLLGRELPGDEGNVTRMSVVRIRPGTYVWLLSLALLPLGVVVDRFVTARPSTVATPPPLPPNLPSRGMAEAPVKTWIEQARTGDPAVRSAALQHLAFEARRDTGGLTEALPIFEHALKHETNPCARVAAAQGIEALQGSEAGCRAWEFLLSQADEATVVSAVCAVNQRELSPRLRALLTERPTPGLQSAVIRALARVKDPSTLESAVALLAGVETRGHAIEALEILGDPRALPHLERWVQDATDPGWRDERGAALTMGGLAASAIRRIQAHRS